MELKELVESVTQLFDVSNPNELGDALLNAWPYCIYLMQYIFCLNSMM